MKDRWPNLLPLVVAGVIYLADSIFIYSHGLSLCNVPILDCQTLLEFYGEPFLALAQMLVPTSIIALFIPKRIYKYWLITFSIWFATTLSWMLSISDPRGAWENYRSTAAGFSGIGLFLGTLVWLGIYYFIVRRNKRKAGSISR